MELARERSLDAIRVAAQAPGYDTLAVIDADAAAQMLDERSK